MHLVYYRLYSTQADAHQRGYIWLRIPDLNAHRRANQQYHESMIKPNMLIYNRVMNSTNSILKTANINSDGEFTIKKPKYNKHNTIVNGQIATQGPKNDIVNVVSNRLVTEHWSDNVKYNIILNRKIIHQWSNGTNDNVASTSQHTTTGSESKNSTKSEVSVGKHTSYIADKIITDGQWTKQISSDAKAKINSNRFSTAKSFKFRHKIKLSTRYGNFWVSAEGFRRPFDSLANGIIG